MMNTKASIISDIFLLMRKVKPERLERIFPRGIYYKDTNPNGGFIWKVNGANLMELDEETLVKIRHIIEKESKRNFIQRLFNV